LNDSNSLTMASQRKSRTPKSAAVN
jgi:hypothetical protein